MAVVEKVTRVLVRATAVAKRSLRDDCVCWPMWKSRDPKSRSNGTVAAETCAAATRMHPNGLPLGEPELKSRRARLVNGPILLRAF